MIRTQSRVRCISLVSLCLWRHACSDVLRLKEALQTVSPTVRQYSDSITLHEMLPTLKTYLPNKLASIRLQNFDSVMRYEDASRLRRITDVFRSGQGLQQRFTL